MRLTHLSGELYGAVTYDLDIPPVALVIGANATGKSTLLSLPGRALRGPARGDGGPWKVSASWGDLTVSRVVTPTGGHQAKYGQHTKPTAVTRALSLDVGAAWCWSVSDWLAMSERKRTAPLRQFLSFHWDKADVRAALEGGGVDLAMLDQIQTDFGWQEQGEDGQGYLQQVIDGLGLTWRKCNARTKESRASADSAQRKLDQLDLPSGTVAQWRDRLATTRERKQTLASQLGAAEERTADADRQLATLPEKREALAKIDVDPDAAEERVLTAATADVVVAQALRQASLGLATATATFQSACSAVAEERVDQGIREHPLFIRAREIMAELPATPRLDAVSDWLEDAARAAEPSQDLPALQAKVAASERIVGRRTVARNALQDTQSKTPEAMAHLEGIEQRQVMADQLRDDIERIANLSGQGAEVALVTEQMTAVDLQIQEMTRSLDRLNDTVQLRSQIDAAHGEITLAVSSRDMVTAYGKAARAVYGRMATEATGGLVGPASRICRAVLDMDLALDIQDGSRIILGGEPLATRTQSQRTIAILAFQAAVQMQMGGWKALNLDGLEHIDKSHRTALMDVLAAIVDEGLLDNVLCACVDDGWRWAGGQIVLGEPDE